MTQDFSNFPQREQVLHRVVAYNRRPLPGLFTVTTEINLTFYTIRNYANKSKYSV